jgi:hypothetical protein
MQAEAIELLRAILKGNHAPFRAFVRQAEYSWGQNGLDVTGKFFYLPFGADGKPAVEQFTELVYGNIINFCIPRGRRAEIDLAYEETRDTRHLLQISDEARDLFVRAIQSQKTSGEAGELILYMLLEAFLEAPQIASKMYLKTNANIPVHGSDGIHLARGVHNGNLRLIWGESKLHADLSNALDSICASVSAFYREVNFHTPRDHDISVIRKHLDIDDTSLRSELLRYFDPYYPENLYLEESIACFVGFNYKECEEISKLRGPELERYFSERYLQRVASACALFEEKIRASELSHLTFYFFLLPLPSVDELRKRFFAKLRLA